MEHILIHIFYPYEYHMDLCSGSCLSVQPTVCPVIMCGKNCNFGYYMQTFQPTFFVPAMLIGTIYFYHVRLLSLTLTLPGGHNVSAKQNLLASFSPTLFI